MKNILESSEVFTAYATIDASYYLLQELQKDMDKPISNIERMIDDATGYGEAKIMEWRNSAISLMETIIEQKKFIEADYSNDEKILTQLKEKLNNHE